MTIDQNMLNIAYTKHFSPTGRLIYYIAQAFIANNQPIILEDLSLITGEKIEVCIEWLDKFTRDGQLSSREGVAVWAKCE